LGYGKIIEDVVAEFVECISFAESDGAGTYTGEVVVPANSIVLDVVWINDALWTAATSAVLNVGDEDDPDGYFSNIDLKSAPLAATAKAPVSISSFAKDTGSGAYEGVQKYSNTEQTITATIVTTGTTGKTGRSKMFVRYATPVIQEAVKSTSAE
jgi:hypothetical protein